MKSVGVELLFVALVVTVGLAHEAHAAPELIFSSFASVHRVDSDTFPHDYFPVTRNNLHHTITSDVPYTVEYSLSTSNDAIEIFDVPAGDRNAPLFNYTYIWPPQVDSTKPSPQTSNPVNYNDDTTEDDAEVNFTIRIIVTDCTTGEIITAADDRNTINVAIVPGSGAAHSGSFATTEATLTNEVEECPIPDDTTAPTINVPANITVPAKSVYGAIVDYDDYGGINATDDVDGAIPAPNITLSHPSGSEFPIDTTTVTASTEDKTGNSAEASFDITVTNFVSPAIASFTATATHNSINATWTTVSGYTVTPDTILEVYEDGTRIHFRNVTHAEIEASYAILTHLQIFQTTDYEVRLLPGGDSGQRVTTTVTTATEPAPFTITAPPDLLDEEAEGEFTRVDIGTPTAEGTSGTVAFTNNVTGTGESTTHLAVGTHVIEWTGTYGTKNATDTQTVIVHDRLPPAISVPSNRTLDAQSESGTTVIFLINSDFSLDPTYFAITVDDAVDGDVVPAITLSQGTVSASNTATIPADTTVTVTVNAEDSRGNAADPASFTVTVSEYVEPMPDAPIQNLTFTSITFVSVFATWDVADEDVYPLVINLFGEGVNKTENRNSPSENTVSFGELPAGTEYTFEIKSGDRLLLTEPVSTAPNPLANITATPTHDAITVSWTDRDGLQDTDIYPLDVNLNGGPADNANPDGLEFPATEHVFTGLASNTTYNVGINTSQGEILFHDTVTTLAAPDPSAPITVTSTTSAFRSVFVEWTVVNASAYPLTVELYLNDVLNKTSTLTLPEEVRESFGELDPSTEYEIRISSGGTQIFSDTVTTGPFPVADLDLEPTHDTIVVTWTNLLDTEDDTIHPFHLTITPSDADPADVAFPGTTHTFEGLTPSTQYTVKVQTRETEDLVNDTTTTLPAPDPSDPPTITAPNDILDYEATGPFSLVELGTPTVTGEATYINNVTGTSSTVANLTLGTHTVLWTATGSGGTDTDTQTVEIVDTTEPQILNIRDIRITATDSEGTHVRYSHYFDIRAQDTVDGPVGAQPDPLSGARFVIGDTLVTVTSQDRSNNTATANFTVTVGPYDANPGITVSVPASQTINVTSLSDFSILRNQLSHSITSDEPWISTYNLLFPAGVTPLPFVSAPTAKDADADLILRPSALPVAGDSFTLVVLAQSCATGEITSDSGTVTFGSPATTVDFDISAETLALNVEGPRTDDGCPPNDVTDPIVTAPPDTSIEARAPFTLPTTAELGEATATDDTDGILTPEHDIPEDGLRVGSHLVNWTAMDTAGNTGRDTQIVNITDTTDPVFSQHPLPNVTLVATPVVNVALFNTDLRVYVTDNGDAIPTVDSSPQTGTSVSVGTHNVTVTARDDSGNVAESWFWLIVTEPPADNEAPVINGVEDIVVAITSRDGVSPTDTIAVNYEDHITVTVTDNVDDDLVPVFSRPSGSAFTLGNHTITVGANDNNGNTATPQTFVVSVVEGIYVDIHNDRVARPVSDYPLDRVYLPYEIRENGNKYIISHELVRLTAGSEIDVRISEDFEAGKRNTPLVNGLKLGQQTYEYNFTVSVTDCETGATESDWRKIDWVVTTSGFTGEQFRATDETLRLEVADCSVEPPVFVGPTLGGDTDPQYIPVNDTEPFELSRDLIGHEIRSTVPYTVTYGDITFEQTGVAPDVTISPQNYTNGTRDAVLFEVSGFVNPNDQGATAPQIYVEIIVTSCERGGPELRLTKHLVLDHIDRTPSDASFEATDQTLSNEVAECPVFTSSSGSDSDWQKKPTFGINYLTDQQIVSCGYAMDDTCRDVLDYHVGYERQIIHTDSEHDFTLKAYTEGSIRTMTIGFGVTEIGQALSNAEATISVILSRDYDVESTYVIQDVIIHDPENLIDYDPAHTTVSLVDCSAAATIQCAQVTLGDVLFREQFYSEPFIINAVDVERRSTTHYMNEGILVQGESLNPAPTDTAGIHKETSQADAVSIELVRIDKLADLWEDQFGHVWTKNHAGTWQQLTFDSPEPRNDRPVTVMTRHHSAYESLVEAERLRAEAIFDSSAIQNDYGQTFSYDIAPKVDKKFDLELLSRLAAEAKRAQNIVDGSGY